MSCVQSLVDATLKEEEGPALCSRDEGDTVEGGDDDDEDDGRDAKMFVHCCVKNCERTSIRPCCFLGFGRRLLWVDAIEPRTTKRSH